MNREKFFRQQLLARRVKSLVDESFPEQANFIRDPARLKAAQCTRRAAKSYADGIGLFEAALSQPAVSCLYLGLTTNSAKNIMIKDVLKPLNRKHNLNAHFVEHPYLECRLPNESIIYLTGVDASEDEKDKIFGQKFKRVIVDEGGAFSIDTESLIMGTLFPATADYKGDIWFTGMPTNRINSFFKKVCDGIIPGWSVHKWSALQNPYIRDQFQADMEEMIKLNPLVVETPWFQQMYQNQWVVDLKALVYKFNEDRNYADKLPESNKPWNYVLGVDLGWRDATAFSVLAWNENIREVYGVESFKKTEMDFFDVAKEINRLKEKYGFWRVVIDGSNKQAVETMKRRLGVPELLAAEKKGKAEFIDILNSEMIQGYIKLMRHSNEPLVKEYEELIWDPKKKERTEHSACENHCADSWLYPWRETYSYLYQKETVQPKPTPVQQIDAWWEKEAEELERQKSTDFWEKDWG